MERRRFACIVQRENGDAPEVCNDSFSALKFKTIAESLTVFGYGKLLIDGPMDTGTRSHTCEYPAATPVEWCPGGTCLS